MKDELNVANMRPSVAIVRQVRMLVYINDVEFKSEWQDYNPVNLTNQVQACVQNGHTFTVEVR